MFGQKLKVTEKMLVKYKVRRANKVQLVLQVLQAPKENKDYKEYKALKVIKVQEEVHGQAV